MLHLRMHSPWLVQLFVPRWQALREGKQVGMGPLRGLDLEAARLGEIGSGGVSESDVMALWAVRRGFSCGWRRALLSRLDFVRPKGDLEGLVEEEAEGVKTKVSEVSRVKARSARPLIAWLRALSWSFDLIEKRRIAWCSSNKAASARLSPFSWDTKFLRSCSSDGSLIVSRTSASKVLNSSALSAGWGAGDMANDLKSLCRVADIMSVPSHPNPSKSHTLDLLLRIIVNTLHHDKQP